MRTRTATLVLFVFLFSLIVSTTSADIVKQARVFFDTKQQALDLSREHLDIAFRGADYFEIITNQDEIEDLIARGFRVEVVHDDLKAHYLGRLDKARDMGGYMTLSEINDWVDSIIAANPTVVSSKVSVGQTIEGRDIWAFKISDAPFLDEDEPELLYTAAIHAREVITPLVLRHFIEHLLQNYGVDPDITDLIDNREMWFVMCVNPDGYYRNEVTDPGGGGMWRKNRRNNGDGTYGVDLNRNFGYEWGYDDDGSSPNPGDETYRGTAAFSEPETQAMRDFHIAHDFIISVYYHSYSNLILWPWGYDYLITPDHDIFKEMGDSVVAFNGYTPTPASGLYTANGVTDDWIYGEQTLKNKTFAFTPEVGGQSDGFWPPTSRIDDLIEENLGGNLFWARIAADPYVLRIPAKPVVMVADSVDSAGYTVDWTHYDTLNPAVSYELTEMEGYSRSEDPADNFNAWTHNGYEVSTMRSYSAPSSFYSQNGDDLNHFMTLAAPIKVLIGDSLKFWTWYDIETDWDYAYVEISTDGGMTFAPIEGNITTESDPHGNNLGHGITGQSSGWVEAAFDLSDYIGMDVLYRFTYRTDSYVTNDGIWIDDVTPTEQFDSETIVASAVSDTSYTFNNHESGIFYYKVRARDAQSQLSLFSGFVTTEVFAGPSYICGDANGDLTGPNIVDLTFLVEFMFNGGEAPPVMAAADVSGSGDGVNVADLTRLVDYLFGSGDPLSCL